MSKQPYGNIMEEGGSRAGGFPTTVPRKLLLAAKDDLAKLRSSSAPPSVEEQQASTPLPDDEEDYRADPAYVSYYQNQRLLNPRLPPPVGHHWKGNLFNHHSLGGNFGDTGGASTSNQKGWNQGNTTTIESVPAVSAKAPTLLVSDSGNTKRSSLVDRIQEDFPRTPSPVYQKQKAEGEEGGESFANQPQLQAPQTVQTSPQRTSYATRTRNMTASTGGANYAAQQPPVGYYPTDNEALLQQMQAMSIDDRHAYGQQMPHPMAMMPQMPYGSPMMSPEAGHPIPTGAYPYYTQYPAMYPPQFMPGKPMMVPYPPQPVNKDASRKAPYYNNPSGVAPHHGGSPRMYDEYYAGQPGWEAQQPTTQVQYPPQPTTNNQSNKYEKNRRGPKPQKVEVEAPASPQASNVPRSKVMEEFKKAGGRKFELKDIIGHVREFSRDQHGSRFIQQKLETANAKDKEAVFAEISPEALDLMTDVFGNYVIQKFFEFGSPTQRKHLAKSLKGHVLELTLQTYGCRVIQKALEVLEDEDKKTLAEELNGSVVRCVQDQNGNHVIQKCIEKIPAPMIQFIVDSFVGHVLSQAVHAYGCRVIQRILEFCSEKQTKPILDELVASIQKLVKDQYGNYVVQHVLEHGLPKYKTAIIKGLKGHLAQLSQNKFASNVVEKCYYNGSKRDRAEMLDEILDKTKDVQNSPLFIMIKDQYANYVIQKMMEQSDDGQRKQLLDSLRPHIPAIRRLAFGKHIISTIEKYEKVVN